MGAPQKQMAFIRGAELVYRDLQLCKQWVLTFGACHRSPKHIITAITGLLPFQRYRRAAENETIPLMIIL